MKNPNRFGSVTKLSGNRRKPWMAREGQTGHQKVIGYAQTKQEAMILLADYNKQPWDIDASRMTLQELYDLWLEKRACKLNKSVRNACRSAYKHCSSLSPMRYNQIRAYHMQDCIDGCGKGAATQATIKNLWRKLDSFAMEIDLIDKKYSDMITSDTMPESTKEVFTDEEVTLLWQNENVPGVDTVLFLLYTGFRISEMMEIKIDDVDLTEETIRGGVKTAAGKNRIVPIHSKILHIVKNRYEQSSGVYLFEYKPGQKYTDTAYRDNIWSLAMAKFGMKHTPHECRHTLRSRLDSAGANKVCIDRIIGHKSKDTGERVYTHKTIEELRRNIELVTN